MAERRILKDNGVDILPITHESAVLTDDGRTLDEKYFTKDNAGKELQEYYDKIDDLDDKINKLDESINRVDSKIGELSSLETNTQESIVEAFNELFRYGNETKQKLVDTLIALNLEASTNSTFAELLDYYDRVIKLKKYFPYSVLHDSILPTRQYIEALEYIEAISYKDVIYVSGGWNLGSSYSSRFTSFNPITCTYEAKTSMPKAMACHKKCILNDMIYVVGGFIGTTSTTNSVYAYNPATNTWSTKANLTQSLGGGVCESVNGLIYYMNGYTDGTTMMVNTNYCYDPSTDTWSTKAQTPAAVYQACSFVDNNSLIHYIGGCKYNSTGACQVSQASHRIYDTSSNAFTTGVSLYHSIERAGCICIDNIVYVFPGFYQAYSSSNGYSTGSRNYVYSMNLDTDTSWTRSSVFDYSPLTGLEGYGIASVNNAIYLFGGKISGLTNQAWMYLPK